MDQPTTSLERNPRVRLTELPAYFRTAWLELKKVSWPTRPETIRNTWVVLGVSAFFAIFLGVLDYGLNKLLEFVLRTIS